MLLRPFWTFLRGHSSLLNSPFFPVVFSLSVYLSFCLPFLLDSLSSRWALVRRYKLQSQSSVSWASMQSCLALTFYNHLVFIFPLTVMHWYLRPAYLPEEPPTMPCLLAQVLVCLLLFDFQSFTWHLLHHKVPWLYRNFHKVHHTYTSTSAPLNTLGSGRLSVWASSLPPTHHAGMPPAHELAFFVVNIWLSVEDHCGYDLPWATHRLVPLGLYGGARHHDLHHLKSKYNYAPYFTHWDCLAGTLCTQQD
ncbi:Cholesterol 25-hydroxylase-like protein [Larimichthys crocea]|uniref:Cholesterol 25-hydroxylase-like protein n=1 Tax=Larimichthys crocea TaxID=215358 RepID=A0A6G0HXD0_LARCR|nr:Cholesterol 25-hydroxylase-like protein [Larimichthys crocea]